MEKIKDLEIGAHRFQINKYGMSYRLQMLAKLAQLIAGPAKTLQSNEDFEFLKSQQANVASLSKLLAGVFESIDSEKFPETIKQFLKGTKLKGEYGLVEVSEVFENVFEDISELFDLLKEVISFQFGNDLSKVFQRFLGLSATVKPEATKAEVVKMRAK